MIISVVGITLWTDDLDRMLAFYRDILRLPLHSLHEDEGFAAFELGDIRFNVGRHGGVSGMSKDPLRVMPHLGVDDIHAEHVRLGAAGVEFIRVPEQEHGVVGLPP
jgi:catechol 2,3-dioxygenase-like lactoylglutathione lyase family enzyme